MKLKYLGVPVYMNGQNYYIPSLSYQDFKKYYELLSAKAEVEGEKFFEYFDKMVPVIGAAMRRNYPEVADEQIMEWIDLNSLPLAIRAVQGASGMTAVAEGE